MVVLHILRDRLYEACGDRRMVIGGWQIALFSKRCCGQNVVSANVCIEGILDRADLTASDGRWAGVVYGGRTKG